MPPHARGPPEGCVCATHAREVSIASEASVVRPATAGYAKHEDASLMTLDRGPAVHTAVACTWHSGPLPRPRPPSRLRVAGARQHGNLGGPMLSPT